MSHSDWIPRREQDLVDLAEKWVVILSDPVQISAYAWDQAECTEVSSKITAFLTARTVYQTNDSTAKCLIKDETKGEMIDAMRDFANSSIRFNKKIPDEVKAALGVHFADNTFTVHPIPTSQPQTVVENTLNHFEHKLRALNRGRNDASKPADAYGVRYAWQVGGEKPASGKNLPKTKFSRKTTLTVTHTEADKGKTAYYASCYENGKGDIGQWSPVEEGIIG
jgi:hypothetical protein